MTKAIQISPLRDVGLNIVNQAANGGFREVKRTIGAFFVLLTGEVKGFYSLIQLGVVFLSDAQRGSGF